MKAPTAILIVSAVVVCACMSDAPRSEAPAASLSAVMSGNPVETSPCPQSDIYRRCLPPVDPSIEPISLSHPSSDAAAALDRCLGGRRDVEVVSAGRIAHARDAWEYAPLPNYTVEIQSDEPAWLLQLGGDFLLPSPSGAPDANVFHDPLCIVRAGADGYFDVSHADPSAMTKSLPSPTP
jgi:hypothetical protein